MKSCLACAVCFLSTLGAVAAARAEAPAKADVVPALQKGGYVLFMRHPKTHPDQADTDPLHMDNVKAQRQLSDEGRKQARGMGEAFRALKIPVGSVMSSKFARAQEAAALLGVGKVEASIDVSEGGLVVSPNENSRRAGALKKLLGTAPPAGKNAVIVSHKGNLQDAAGKDLGDVAEGEVVIFQPLGDGKSKVIARVPADVWTTWIK
jgi:phosphohistidine phosphatase SixA